MPKVNPWSYPLEEPKRLARTLRDARKKIEVPFAVRKLNGIEQQMAAGNAAEPTLKYVQGVNGDPPAPLICGDTALDLSQPGGADIILHACILEAYQDMPEDERYTWHELIGWQQRSATIYRQMQALCAEVEEGAEGNGSGATTGNA